MKGFKLGVYTAFRYKLKYQCCILGCIVSKNKLLVLRKSVRALVFSLFSARFVQIDFLYFFTGGIV